MVETLFTPWRFDYVSTVDTQPKHDCVFCVAYQSADDRATHTLWRWQRTFALLNRFPYTSGHSMVAPIRHGRDLDDLDPATLSELMLGARTLIRALRSVYQPHAFNVGFNVGSQAGAGIEQHLHLHVVPRWTGDTSFMTVVSGARVIPEDLDRTFDKLSEALRRQMEVRDE